MKTYYVVSVLVAFIVLGSYAFCASLGDPFDGNKLQNPNWKWANEPAKWDVGVTAKGYLTINAENNRNLWDVDTVAKLYQEVTSDRIDVETHLIMDYKGTGSCVAGIVMKSEKDANWTTLKFWGRGGDAILQWQHRQQEVVANVPGSSQPAGRVEVYMRVVKNGDEYIGYWKKSAGDSWIEITPHANRKLTPPLQVGIYAGNCEGGGTMVAQFEYFNDNITPFAMINAKTNLISTWAYLKSH